MSHAKKNSGGGEVIEYYHRYVVCQLVVRPIPLILDIEPVLPGEGETTAAKRMISRILAEQPRMVDLFTFDALYADSSLLRALTGAGKFWIVVLKDEHRDAYDEINRRLPRATPTTFQTGGAEATLWDMRGLVGWDALGAPFRAVVSEEKKWVLRLNAERKREKVLETSHWRWLTSLPECYPAEAVHRLGHGRWDIENRCFNELNNQCRFSHPFHHHPNALLAMLWLISLSFILSYAFFERNLKPKARAGVGTRANLARLLLISLAQLNQPVIPPRPT